jgi:hypothetical protein
VQNPGQAFAGAPGTTRTCDLGITAWHLSYVPEFSLPPVLQQDWLRFGLAENLSVTVDSWTLSMNKR